MNRRYIDVDLLLDLFRDCSESLYELGLYNHHALTENFIMLIESRPVYNVCDILKREGISTEVEHE